MKKTLINPKITRTRNSVNVNWFSVSKALITLFKLHQNPSSLTPLVYKVTEDLIILRKVTIRDNKRIVVPKKAAILSFIA
jgi:hypothetical protein